ncbi:MAG: biotin--[acetyl-CoA-carboxylase] ligase [Syntrophobacteraceae bacterium]|jgi:BirA family biotin operon repressor/biotin-[acetyl-CoA-carboxylase] ligase
MSLMGPTKPTQLEILKILKQNEGSFVSGVGLAERLAISRPGVWKHINRLKEMGYEIQSRPRLGYRLVAVPDSLAHGEIVPNLKTKWLAHSYHYLRTIGSTNDYALLLAVEGALHGTLVVAEGQTKGRGRLRRQWISYPNRGIYLSILLRNPLPVRIAPQSAYIGALALVKMLREEFGITAAIKWPNDVLINGRKVAGILTETQSDQDFSRFSVMGIGINVNHSREEMGGPFRYPATSIAIEVGFAVKRQRVLLEFLSQFERDYDHFLQKGLSVMIPEFEAHSEVLGKIITVVCGDREIKGKAQGFTPEGALLLLREDGSQETVWAGDVSYVERVV